MLDRLPVLRIETAALWAWPPKETAYVDGWLLRASGGPTRRVNSVQTNGFDEWGDVAEAISRVEEWYESRALPVCFQINSVSAPADLDGELERRGYVRISPTFVQTATLGNMTLDEAANVELLPRASQAVANALFDDRWSDALRRERASLFARIRRPHYFALMSIGGVPAAGGLVVLDNDLAGIFSMHTQPPFRRQGLARHVLMRLLRWARDQGAEQAYLQVEEDNSAAIPLYEAFGFRPLYEYWYRERV